MQSERASPYCEWLIFASIEEDYIAYLLLYVDYIILITSLEAILQCIIYRLYSKTMIDLGDMHYFFDTSVSRSSDGMFLSQHQYVVDLLQRADMAKCSTSTPMDACAKMSVTDGTPVDDPIWLS